MQRLAADHRRILGNGMCNPPVTLACSFEAAGERCNFFFDRLIEDVDGKP
jgi:hypothetical protein